MNCEDCCECCIPLIRWHKNPKQKDIVLYDIGGGKTIRGIWPSYFAELYGLIYVVDSADISRIEECREVLFSLYSDERLSGKPVLILANKQDVDGALSDGELLEKLKIDSLANSFKCPSRLESCSLVSQKLDPSVKIGLKWLIKFINSNKGRLREKINHDMCIQAEKEELEKVARRLRIQQAREARLRELKIEEPEQRSPAMEIFNHEHLGNTHESVQILNLKDEIKTIFEEELEHQYHNAGYDSPKRHSISKPTFVQRLKAGAKTHPTEVYQDDLHL
ncbi:ADP-ribosylation factor-like protein 13B [Cichlidogyrus casuarinus]|uniref:ADP-ribosylation factor-like protein 13B n=1 Tax=Cichlidogyrus casuarinus TaxID=1844966 RepID=A0ABD2QIH5_9PLAT